MGKDTAVKVVIAVGAICGGAYVLARLLTRPAEAAIDELGKQLKEVVEDYLRECREVSAAGRVPNAGEEAALNYKEEVIDDLSQKIVELGGNPWDVIRDVLLALAIGVPIVYFTTGIAKTYIRERFAQVKTGHAAVQLLRAAESLELGYTGRVSLGIAWQDTTEAAFTLYDKPLMIDTMGALQAQLPYLTGLSLVWAQYMIVNLQLEMTMIIPTVIFAPVWTLLPGM